MLRRLISLILSVLMVLLNLASSEKQDIGKINNGEVFENDFIVTSQLEIDGSIVKCIYEKELKEYNLYLDDNKYNLFVDIVNDIAMVGFKDTKDIDLTNNVMTQSVSVLAATSPYWAPAIVAAAKVVIAAVVSATAAVATYYSIDLIATTINNVRSKRITKSDLKSKTKTAVKAIDLVQTAKKDMKAYYYEAYLYKGNVMVGNQINFSSAVSRLKRGCDVFASNVNASLGACKAASTNGKVHFHAFHKGEGIMFPHYHPEGRKWILDTKSMPHCWFASI